MTIATLLGQFENLGTLMGNVWDLMTANPLLLLFTCVSLVGIGVGVFRSIKRAARH